MTIRGLDEKLYRKAKSRAAEEGKNMGEYVNEALQVQLATLKKKHTGKTLWDLFDHPIDMGIKTDFANEVDEYVYR